HLSNADPKPRIQKPDNARAIPKDGLSMFGSRTWAERKSPFPFSNLNCGGEMVPRAAGICRTRASDLPHLALQDLDPIGDLPRRHVEQARGLGLHPAGLLEGGDDALALVEVGVVEVDRLDGAASHR